MGNHHHGGAPVPDYKNYKIIFIWLLVLTLVEVFAAELNMSATNIMWLMISMALVKAFLVIYYYMHLNHETGYMKYIILTLMAVPGVYAAALCIEAIWRMSGLNFNL